MRSRVLLVTGPDGFPLVAYNGAQGGTLKLAKCADAACSRVLVTTPYQVQGDAVGGWPGLALGVDGLPIVTSYDWSSSDLAVVHLANPLGLSHWWRRG